MSNLVSSDPIADMLTRIRNAIAVQKAEITLPYSKLKQAVAELLKTEQYIDSVSVEGDIPAKQLVIRLNGERENARITEIARMSKPGRRQYVTAEAIPVVKRGRGLVIVSTSQGLMSGEQARAKGIGGELICTVY